jgi:hypothetical protein
MITLSGTGGQTTTPLLSNDSLQQQGARRHTTTGGLNIMCKTIGHNGYGPLMGGIALGTISFIALVFAVIIYVFNCVTCEVFRYQLSMKSIVNVYHKMQDFAIPSKNQFPRELLPHGNKNKNSTI